MEMLKAAIAVALVLGVLDGIWLGFIVRDWLVKQFGGRLRDPVFWPPAIVFYVIYSVGLAFFAVTPAMAAGGDEARRAFQAMMIMTKIDVAAIEAARRG